MVESREEFKAKNKIGFILQLAAAVIWIICIVVPAVTMIHNEAFLSGVLAGLAVGVIFASIPFVIGESVKRKAFLEYGEPFVRREQECIKIYDDGVEYLFHYTPSQYEENMDIYRIPIENMNAVNYNQEYHVITIIGKGELLSDDNYAEKRLNHYNSQRRFYSNSPYYLITAFDEENQVVELLKSMAKNKRDD